MANHHPTSDCQVKFIIEKNVEVTIYLSALVDNSPGGCLPLVAHIDKISKWYVWEQLQIIPFETKYKS